MRALVTGAAGYIGSHLCHRLKSEGWEVDGLDLHASGSPAVDRWIIASVDDRLPAFQSYDVVFHLAALIDVEESQREPDRYHRTNGAGTIHVLEATQATPIVFASTAAVYATADHPISEDDPLSPASAYGESKLFAERMIRESSSPHAILRFFNVAGCGFGLTDNHQRITHLIPTILRDRRLTVYGEDYPTRDGTCLRDFVHVLDLCDAMLASAHRLSNGRSFTANLGSGVGFTVREVADAAGRVLDGLSVHSGPRRPGDPPALVARVDRARAMLSFHPRHDLDGMIRSHRL